MRLLKMPLRARIDPKRISLTRMYSSSEANEVLFRPVGATREIILNRPKKLNAINDNMVQLMLPRLTEYIKSDEAGNILIKGAGGKAFSAGGDVTSLALTTKNEGIEKGGRAASKYFRDEFSLDHLIATYPKPYIAIMDGIVMGGGVGLSAHGSHRIGTEKTMFAMPETTIGYYPDVGGLFFLGRLDGYLGLYLALTSARLTGWNAYIEGIVSHFVPHDKIPEVEARLAELAPTDAKEATSKEYFDKIATAIEEFAQGPPADHKPMFSKADRELIDEAFALKTVEEILAKLEAAGTDFATKTAKTIRERCPTSVKVTIEAFHKMRKIDILSSFKLEANLCDNFGHHTDFSEGVIALLVEKRPPKWNPPTLEETTPAHVSSFLQPREDTADLGGIPFVTETTFKQYPHKYGLPSEEDIKQFVIGESSPLETKATRQDVYDHFEQKGPKVGLKERIDWVLDRKTTTDKSDSSLLDWKY